jgi:hypothetical protein
MTEGCAPVRLPVTRKPLRTELFSSWWLRVAAANFVSARELLCGFHSRHPEVPLPSSLDSCLDPVFLKAIAHFCRAPIAALQSLDLVQRLPHSQHALLLRFGSASPSCHRHCDLRVGYAFCPICIAEHPIVHVPWDWCLACLVCCSVHGTSLQLGCHSCGEPDPISFVVPPTHACWSCGADLTSGPRTLDGLRKPASQSSSGHTGRRSSGLLPTPHSSAKSVTANFDVLSTTCSNCSPVTRGSSRYWRTSGSSTPRYHPGVFSSPR